MAFDIQVAHSVREIGQEAWDRLGRGRPFASYHWYRFGETVLADNVPIYVVLSRRGEPVARGTFWLRRREQLPIASRVARCAIDALLHRRPVLMCQAPLVETSGLILPDPPLREAALKAIARASQEQARRYRASFLSYLYLGREEAGWAGWSDALAGPTVFQFPEPRTCLTITWPDFESYLRHLSRSARRDYRRHCKRAAARGIEVGIHPLERPLDGATLDRAVALVRNVERRHNSGPHPWARRMLELAYMVDATWLTAKIGDRLVGCDLLFGDGDTRVMTLLGLDYDVQYAYFQLMYAPIRRAIEEGARTLWGGSGSYEMKRRLGFRIEARHYIIFASENPLLQKFGRWAAAMGGSGGARA